MKHRQITKRIAYALGLAALIYIGYGVVTLFLWNMQFSMGMDLYQRAASVDEDSSTLLTTVAPQFQRSLALNPYDSSSLSFLGRIRIKEMLDHLREGRQQEGLTSAREAAAYLLDAIRTSPAEAENRLFMGYLLIALNHYHPVPRELQQRYMDSALTMAPAHTRTLHDLIALYRSEAEWDRAVVLLRKFSALVIEKNPQNLDFLRTDTSSRKMLELTREFLTRTVETDPDISQGTLPVQKYSEPTSALPLLASGGPALQDKRTTGSSLALAAKSFQETPREATSVVREMNEPSEEIKSLLTAMAEADASRQRFLQEKRQPVLQWFSRVAAGRNPFILDESLAERERDEVLNGMEDVVGRDPAQAPLIHIYTACVARVWNRGESALQHLQQAAEMLPQNPLILEALGDLHREMGATDNALASYRKALGLPDHSVSVYHRIAQIQLDRGEPAAAEQTFRNAMLMYPDHHAPYTWLGDYYYRYAQRYNLAIAMFQKAKEIQPHNPLPYAGIAYSLEAMGQEAEAVRYFLEAASRQYNSELYRAEAARIYQKQGKYREAVGILRLALARRPSDPEALLRMGELHLALKDYPSAAGYFEQCLMVNPLHYWARLGAALAREQMDQPIKAIELLEAAKTLYPGQAKTYEHLARIYEKMGETEKASELKQMTP